MMILAAWCAGMTLLAATNRFQDAWVVWIAVIPAWFLHQAPWAVALCGGLSCGLVIQARRLARSRLPNPMEVRHSLVRFWQQVSVLLTAGLTFWQAVEVSAGAEQLAGDFVGEAAQAIAQKPQREPPSSTPLATADGSLTWMLLQHGYLHGLASTQVDAEVHHMEARLRYEEEARKRRDPLWMTVLPALLLVNVLWIFVAPMLAMASSSWLKI